MFPARAHSRNAAAAEGRAAEHSGMPRSCPRHCGARGCGGSRARARTRGPSPRRHRCHGDPSQRSPAHAPAPGRLHGAEVPERFRSPRRTHHRAQAARATAPVPARVLRLSALRRELPVAGDSKAKEASAYRVLALNACECSSFMLFIGCLPCAPPTKSLPSWSLHSNGVGGSNRLDS